MPKVASEARAVPRLKVFARANARALSIGLASEAGAFAWGRAAFVLAKLNNCVSMRGYFLACCIFQLRGLLQDLANDALHDAGRNGVADAVGGCVRFCIDG